MIRRLLIANRGEIARRIIRCCREMDIETIAVYSEADADSPHVAEADEAVPIGPAPAASSYLSVTAIVNAARHARADAVHPGYGFLSERPELAAACQTAGLIFVGPPSTVIASMGSKIEARRVMQAAGVPIVPGETPSDQTDAGVRRALERVGSPALIKASAGGGGKGMRAVAEGVDVLEAIAEARREATAAFGDGTLYVERLIERPRHVEVQVLADQHGAVVHLFERDCSAQRRHQKIVEESPSPAVTPSVRARITEAAVAAARAARYCNAGTIEFLLEGEGDAARFHFLEMNTRLQVEHPVTEAVAGVDIVRAQILVAGGAPLPWTQESLIQRGHAIEARIYAEDPGQHFLPQAGRLLVYREPTLPGVRIDAGVREGSSISIHYDALVAKVIASAETRGQAIARLAGALRSFPILGVQTNVPFLLALIVHPDFANGRIDSGFVDRQCEALSAKSRPEMPAFLRSAAAQITVDRTERQPAARGVDPWSAATGWRS